MLLRVPYASWPGQLARHVPRGGCTDGPGTNREAWKDVQYLSLALLFTLACSEPAAAPLTITYERQIAHTLPNQPALQVTVRAPHTAAYQGELVGSQPKRVDVAVVDVSGGASDISGAHIAFRPHRNGVLMKCPPVDAVPLREPHWIRPEETVVFERMLCSLPLPGRYSVDVLMGFGGTEALTRAGSFDIEVTAKGPRVPRAVQSRPGLWAAMGADLAGVRYTAAEWKAGTYHVVVRLTNAGSGDVEVGRGKVSFNVSREGHPLACTSSHDLTLPATLASGDDVAVQVPVTCLIDVKGRYQIDASLALGDEETALGSFGVEVTSDPLLYLPTWPITPW